MIRWLALYLALVAAAAVLPLTSLGDARVRYFEPLDDLFLERLDLGGVLDDEELLEVLRDRR